MPSKIEGSLTPEQFWDFCHRVAQMKGGRKGATLREIKALAAEWDIIISENSAKSFRDGAFKEFLDELKADRELADDVAMVAKAGSDLPDAAAHVLSKKIFQTTLRLGDNVDPETADMMTKSVERLRAGNRNARRLQADLQVVEARLAESEKKQSIAAERIKKLTDERDERDRKKAELAQTIATAKKRGGLTPETLALIEEKAKLL